MFGVRGEVRLHLHHRESDLFARPRDVVLVGPDEQRVSARLQARPGAGKRVLGRIDGVGDPQAAATWMDWRIVIPTDQLPAPAADEFYVWEVEGLPAFVGDEQVGVVVAVHSTAGGEVFEIETDDGAFYVPSIRELVLDVDVEGGRVELAPEALDE